jgi:hypothetical protein
MSIASSSNVPFHDPSAELRFLGSLDIQALARDFEQAFPVAARNARSHQSLSPAQANVLAKIEGIREEVLSLLPSLEEDPMSSADCQLVLGILEQLKKRSEGDTLTNPAPHRHAGPEPDTRFPIDPAERLHLIQAYERDLDDTVHHIQYQRYREAKKGKLWKKRAVKAAGIASGFLGVAMMGAGAAVGAAGLGGLASALGTPAGLGALAAAGAIEMVGVALAGGGPAAAVYYHRHTEPASQQYARKYHPDEMSEGVFNVGGVHSVLTYKERQRLIHTWAKDRKVIISKEEESWYALKSNFERWQSLSQMDGSKADRKNLAKLMNFERNHVLWGCSCPDH